MSSLEINYRTKKLEKTCENYKTAVCSYGRDMASKIAQRIGEIRAIDAVEMCIRDRYRQARIGRYQGYS